jgi:hypothetical protein
LGVVRVSAFTLKTTNIFSPSCCFTTTTKVTRYVFYARSLATCKQGLVALAPHVKIFKLSNPMGC